MTEGKKFEYDFKKSIPKDVWFYRFKDGTASWGTEEQKENSPTRFQAKNICDCELFYVCKLFLLELKTTKQKNLPFSMVRANQIKELTEASFHEGIVSGFVINFRAVNETYFMSIGEFNQFFELNERKSIPLDYFQKRCKKIDQVKKISRFTYAIKDFILNFNSKDNLIQRNLFSQK